MKSNGKIEKVLYDELVYVEAMLNYVMLHTVNGKLMVYLTMKSLEEQLPSSLFMKVHKSTIINKTKIKAIQGNELDLGKATVTISQGLYDKVINEIVKNKLISK